MIVADNGSNFFSSGASYSVDASNNFALTWNDNDIQDSTHGLKSLTFSDFEVVDLTPVVTGLSPASGSRGLDGHRHRPELLRGRRPSAGPVRQHAGDERHRRRRLARHGRRAGRDGDGRRPRPVRRHRVRHAEHQEPDLRLRHLRRDHGRPVHLRRDYRQPAADRRPGRVGHAQPGDRNDDHACRSWAPTTRARRTWSTPGRRRPNLPARAPRSVPTAPMPPRTRS